MKDETALAGAFLTVAVAAVLVDGVVGGPTGTKVALGGISLAWGAVPALWMAANGDE